MTTPEISTSIIDLAVWPGRSVDAPGQLVLGTSSGFVIATNEDKLLAPNPEVSP